MSVKEREKVNRRAFQTCCQARVWWEEWNDDETKRGGRVTDEALATFGWRTNSTFFESQARRCVLGPTVRARELAEWPTYTRRRRRRLRQQQVERLQRNVAGHHSFKNDARASKFKSFFHPSEQLETLVAANWRVCLHHFFSSFLYYLLFLLLVYSGQSNSPNSRFCGLFRSGRHWRRESGLSGQHFPTLCVPTYSLYVPNWLLTSG